MIKSLIHHKVEDFARWKTAFDSFADTRKKSGEMSYSVGTVNNNPNIVYVINEWKSAQDLQNFLDSPELAAAMQNAGVLEAPNIFILNELENG